MKKKKKSIREEEETFCVRKGRQANPTTSKRTRKEKGKGDSDKNRVQSWGLREQRGCSGR